MNRDTSPAGEGFRCVAFGARWQSAVPLAAFEPTPGDSAPPDIIVHLATDPVPPRLALHVHNRLQFMHDGVRFASDEFVADVFGLQRIEVRRGPGWTGRLPSSFFGTVTAAMLTIRGGIAMHGSAVEVDGEAMLICGASGAGKSSLTAALIAAGARLLSDDLTVLHPQPGGQLPLVYPGRRTLRLFPDVAELLAQSAAFENAFALEDRKLSIELPHRAPGVACPLRCVLLLAEKTGMANEADSLRGHLYRPRAFSLLAGLPVRLAQLDVLFRQHRVRTHLPVQVRTRTAMQVIAQETLAAVRQGN